MLTDTIKGLLALACASALLTGCGSSSHGQTASPSVESTPAATASTARVCSTVKTAAAAYQAAIEAESLKLFDKRFADRTIASIGRLRGAIGALSHVSTPAQVNQLRQLDGALSRQSTAVAAALRHDVATARKASAGLNTALSSGRAALAQICPGT